MTAHSGKPMSYPFARRLITGVVLINLFVLALSVIFLNHSLNRHEKQTEITTRNLAQVFEENIFASISRIDLALFSVKDEVEKQLGGGDVDRDSLNQYITKMYKHLDYLESLRVADDNGEVLYGTGVVKRVNITDRDYFIRLRDNPGEDLVFAKPVISRMTGKKVLNIARRINRKDGTFAGVVFAQLTVKYFTDSFTKMDVGKLGSITLRRADMRIIARYPDDTEKLSEKELTKVSTTFKELIDSGSTMATFKARYPIDTIERLYTFHKIGAYPLYINVGKSTSEYLKVWRIEAAVLLCLLTVFSLGTAFLTKAVISRWLAQKMTEDELRAANEMLERRVQERTSELASANECLSEELYERRKSEEELKRNQRLLAIAESMGKVGGWELHVQTGKVIWTKEIYDIHELEYSYEPTLSDGINFYAPASRPVIEQSVQRAIEHGEPYDVELEIISAKGNHKFVHAIGHTEQDRSILSGFFQDVTERKQAEEKIRILNQELESRVKSRTADLERMNKELEDFCYSLSHEFRAPIARLQGFSGIMKELVDTSDNKSIIHCADRIEVASIRLRTVIDGLLSLNRLSRADISKTPVNLSEMSQQILAELLENIGDRSVKITVAPEIVATGDRHLLEICLRNLLTNAVKYTSKTAEATVEFGTLQKDGEDVYFVRDNGAGFNMEYSKNLFIPFCRLHTQAEFEGTGIGLATVHRIIEKHNGRIWAEAAEGKGATFYFTIKLL